MILQIRVFQKEMTDLKWKPLAPFSAIVEMITLIAWRVPHIPIYVGEDVMRKKIYLSVWVIAHQSLQYLLPRGDQTFATKSSRKISKADEKSLPIAKSKEFKKKATPKFHSQWLKISASPLSHSSLASAVDFTSESNCSSPHHFSLVLSPSWLTSLTSVTTSTFSFLHKMQRFAQMGSPNFSAAALICTVTIPCTPFFSPSVCKVKQQPRSQNWSGLRNNLYCRAPSHISPSVQVHCILFQPRLNLFVQ